mgnify:CR=1 FL=1
MSRTTTARGGEEMEEARKNLSMDEAVALMTKKMVELHDIAERLEILANCSADEKKKTVETLMNLAGINAAVILEGRKQTISV